MVHLMGMVGFYVHTKTLAMIRSKFGTIWPSKKSGRVWITVTKELVSGSHY